MPGKVHASRRSRVVLADRQALVLEALKCLLSHDVNIVGTSQDGHELIKEILDKQPDVVLSCISLPGINGLDACSRIVRRAPGVKFIFLSGKNDPNLVAEAIRVGSFGYVLKNCTTQELLYAIRAVMAGGKYITPLVLASTVESLVNGGTLELFEKLTIRQREILQQFSQGKTMKEIAGTLHITPRTVAFHKYRIMDVLDIHNNVDLIRFALKNDLS